ncbi:MAG: capsular polysaccharide biosynthesis protein [Caulobacteraceae bacterium]|nr:capsular polysaccharide biosynthesis protein [Caulobacteraceae bacterium]
MTGRAQPSAWRARLGSIAYRVIEQLLDPAQTERYRAANATLLAEADPGPRVVFIGDSMIEGWSGLEAVAPPGLRFVNRGVSGQTSGQILLRFADDAIALTPVAVVILAGANDVRAVCGPRAAIGPAAQARIARHVTAMVDIAQGRGIRVAIATLPPVRPGLAGARRSVARRDPAVILGVNAWLRGFAAARDCPLIDFHAALVGDDGALDGRFTADGLHPNRAGHDRMASTLTTVLGRLW